MADLEKLGSVNNLWLIVIVLALCLFSSQAQSGIRCGTQLASSGDSPVYVSHICGEPEFKQRRSVYRTVGGETTNGRNSAYAQDTIEIVIDEWLYNFGPNRLKKKIIFENGRLESVKSEGYGY